MTYKDYLKTDHWQKCRKKTLNRFRRQCAMCLSGRLLNVHHVRYRDKNGNSILFKETAKDLVLLCRDCHAAIHRAEPLDPERVSKAINRMVGGNHIAKPAQTSRYQSEPLPQTSKRRKMRPRGGKRKDWDSLVRSAKSKLDKSHAEMFAKRYREKPL